MHSATRKGPLQTRLGSILLATVALLVLLLPHERSSISETPLPDLSIGDMTRTHTEIARAPRHEYDISIAGNGTVENESVQIEVLEGIAVNPRLRSSGNVDCSSFRAIVGDVVTPGMTDQEKAIALWRFVTENCYEGPWGTSFNGLEHLTVYGYGYCGTFAAVLEPLWWAAGLRARHVNIGNHAATEVFYDDDWHYLDAHRRCYFLERDNRTIAGLDDLNMDHWLADAKRQGPEGAVGDRKYYYMTMHPDGNGSSPDYTNNFTMAKGDILTLGWSKRGEWCRARGAEGGGDPAPEPPIYANGTFRFIRNLADLEQSRVELVSSRNIDWTDVSVNYRHPKNAREEASFVYRVKTSYFITSAEIGGKFLRKGTSDSIRIDISVDNGKQWRELWTGKDIGVVEARARTESTQEITTNVPWKYSYMVRVLMRADALPRDVGCYLLESTSTLFYNPRALPSLRREKNTVVLSDSSTAARAMRILYTWREIDSIRLSNDAPLEGEEVVLRARVSNHGKAAAENIPVAFFHGDPDRGGVLIGKERIRSIGPGQTADARITWKATRMSPERKSQKTAGALIYVRVNPDKTIRESNLENNTASTMVKVLSPPEIRIASPSFIRLETKPGSPQTLTIGATVRNFSSNYNYGYYLNDNGPGKDIVVKFFDGEPVMGRQIGTDQVIKTLPPLEVKNVAVDWDVKELAGKHRIFVQVLTPARGTGVRGKKTADEVSVGIDLDAYRQCGAEI